MMTVNMGPAGVNFMASPPTSPKLKNYETLDSSFKESLEKASSPGEKKTDIKKPNKPSEEEKEVVDKKKVINNEKKSSKKERPKVENPLQEAYEAVKESLMKKLKLTSKELEEVMANLQINPLDLLSQEGIMEVIQEVLNIKDMSQVLVDENLNTIIKDIMVDIDTILDEETKKQINEMDKFVSQSEVFDLETNQEEVKETINKTTDFQGVNNEREVRNNQETNIEDIQLEVTKAEDGILANMDKDDMGERDDGQGQFLNQFVEGLSNDVQPIEMAIGEGTFDMESVIDQIVEKIKIDIQPSQTSMELELRPESLGRVNLTVNENNGVMTAKMLVENQLTKEAIESQINILMDNLDRQGLKVEAMEVIVSNFDFVEDNESGNSRQGSKEGQRSKRSKSLDEAIGISDQDMEEKILEEMMAVNGSSVNYTA